MDVPLPLCASLATAMTPRGATRSPRGAEAIAPRGVVPITPRGRVSPVSVTPRRAETTLQYNFGFGRKLKNYDPPAAAARPLQTPRAQTAPSSARRFVDDSSFASAGISVQYPVLRPDVSNITLDTTSSPLTRGSLGAVQPRPPSARRLQSQGISVAEKSTFAALPPAQERGALMNLTCA